MATHVKISPEQHHRAANQLRQMLQEVHQEAQQLVPDLAPAPAGADYYNTAIAHVFQAYGQQFLEVFDDCLQKIQDFANVLDHIGTSHMNHDLQVSHTIMVSTQSQNSDSSDQYQPHHHTEPLQAASGGGYAGGGAHHAAHPLEQPAQPGYSTPAMPEPAAAASESTPVGDTTQSAGAPMVMGGFAAMAGAGSGESEGTAQGRARRRADTDKDQDGLDASELEAAGVDTGAPEAVGYAAAAASAAEPVPATDYGPPADYNTYYADEEAGAQFASTDEATQNLDTPMAFGGYTHARARRPEDTDRDRDALHPESVPDSGYAAPTDYASYYTDEESDWAQASVATPDQPGAPPPMPDFLRDAEGEVGEYDTRERSVDSSA